LSAPFYEKLLFFNYNISFKKNFMKKNVHFFLILPFFIFCYQNKTIAQCWNNGDLYTYNQGQWGGDPTFPAGTLLTNNYYSVYASTGGLLLVGLTSNYSLDFDGPQPILTYLPQSGIPGVLTGSLSNPATNASGAFGGDVVVLKLDIDFADAGLFSTNSGLKFGDLVIYGLTSNIDLNGKTAREFLDIANTALGGGSVSYTISDLDAIAANLTSSFDNGTPTTFAQQHLKKGWKNGDVTTYVQSGWGTGAASGLLLNNYNTVYFSSGLLFNIGSNSKYTIEFDGEQALQNYLPQTSSPGVLTASLLDPTFSSSGSFGGNTAALKLNIDFSDSGLLSANSGLKFGNFVIYGLTTNTDLNGKTVREFLDIANTALSGGSTPYSIADLDAIATNLNASFATGTTVSAWAQLHLKRGWQNGDLTTYDQSPWGVPATGVGSILQTNYSTLYASTFGIAEIGIPGSSGFSMQFDVASAVFDYLPSIGTAAALTADLFDPLTSNSGQFGGDVLGLKLNIDFSDAGLLPNNSGLKFGDLTICGLTNNTDLNGKTVRQFLDIVNTALGGGTTTDPISDLDALAIDLNNSFSAGSVSQWTQLYLVNGSCDCGNTVTNQCPTAAAINISTTVGSATKFILQGSDADNNTLTYSISQNPSHGVAVIAGGDSIIYTPTAAYHGTDQLKYKVSDGTCSAEATVNITVIVCPGGQGYWKNNKAGWPVTTLMLGTISYTQAQLMKILNTAVGTGNNADASLILADQLIAAKLSVANGSPAVQHLTDSIAAADALIGGNLIPMKVKSNTVLGKKMISLATFLANYNNGAFMQGCSAPANITGEQLIADNELIVGNKIEQNPGGFVLEQIHPNPFHGSTIISYGLPANGNTTYHVSLKIYDITGREIKTLVTDEEKAGWKTINFDAGNVAAGVYLYRLTANQFSEMKKMIIVK
jgi:hypothetical protein